MPTSTGLSRVVSHLLTSRRLISAGQGQPEEEEVKKKFTGISLIEPCIPSYGAAGCQELACYHSAEAPHKRFRCYRFDSSPFRSCRSYQSDLVGVNSVDADDLDDETEYEGESDD